MGSFLQLEPLMSLVITTGLSSFAELVNLQKPETSSGVKLGLFGGTALLFDLRVKY